MTTQQNTETSERRLERLLERLIASGEAAAAANDWDPARAAAEDVLTVDPGNLRAIALIERAKAAERRSFGERSLMTVMFSDLVDSTPIADASTPEVMRDIYSLYRAQAQKAIARYGGTIVQFLGDGIVASFGYPSSHEDDARRAVLAGLALVAGMEEAQVVAAERHGIEVRVRVGIHTGLVVVGDLGEGPSRERHSIVGVTPNLAARLQGEAEPGMVVISDVTHHLVASDFEVQSLGVRQLRGITRPVEVFAVEGPRHLSSRLTSERYRGPIVGRHQVVERLTEEWNAVREGMTGRGVEEVRSTCLIGHPGIGKSRVVAELLQRVQLDGGLPIVMECLPYYVDIAFYPLQRALEKVLDINETSTDEDRNHRLLEALDEAGLDLTTAAPLLGPLLGLDEVPGYPVPLLDPIALRQLTISTVAEYFGRLAQEQPLLVVAEDIEAADPSTLELLELLSSSPRPGVLTVMTTRQELVLHWFDQVHKVELGGLEPGDAATLIHSLQGPEAIADEVVASIIERAEGIPLFIEELVHSTIRFPGRSEVPMRLQELLTARLHASGVDLGTAQTAATEGVVFHAAVLDSAADDGRPGSSRLAGLLAAGLVVPDGDADEGLFRFYHPLLREAAYETQTLETRRENHAMVAKALAALDAEPGVVARHFDLGGLSTEAVSSYLAATQRAQGLGAHVEAAQLASRALGLIQAWPAGQQRNISELTVRLMRSLSHSSVRGYAAPEVVEDFQKAEELTRIIDPAPEVLPAIIAIWSYRLVHGELPAAAALVDRLVEIADTEIGAWFAAEVAACAGFQSLFGGNLGDAAARLEKAFALFATRPEEEMVSQFWPLPNDPVAVSQVAYSCVLALRGDMAGSAEWERRALDRAESVPFPRGPFSLAFVKSYLAWLRYVLGDLPAAESAARDVVRIGQQYGYAYWMAIGAVFHRVVEPDLAEYQQTLATLAAIGHRAFLPAYLGIRAEIESATDPEAALRTLEEALTVAHEAGEELHVPALLQQRADLWLRMGGHGDEAATDLQAAVEIAQEHESRLLALRAAVKLAGLPEDVKAGNWRELLARQVAALTGAEDIPELDHAAALLG
jgi:class 3 adenylate cyclase/tetratricopeptide (TPR) repeat protein